MALPTPRARTLTRYLTQLYTNFGTGASFGGLGPLYKAVKKDNRYNISKKDVQNLTKSFCRLSGKLFMMFSEV